MKTKRQMIITFTITYLLIACLILLDQLSKIYIEQNYTNHLEKAIIPNFFYITLVYNKGAAWGIGQNNTLLLAILSLIGSLIAIYFATKNDFKIKKTYSIALILIISGAVGNMIDRFLTVGNIREGVVDMLLFKFGTYTFPCFNLADSFLVIGVILLAIDILFFEERRQKCKKDM